MTAEQYRAVFRWFRQRPAAKAALLLASKGAVAAVYAAYLGLLAWLAWRRDGLFWQTLAVPAAAFLLGTGLRAAIDRPRPYEALGFDPLFPKGTRGQSMPSRHCFSAAAIAAAAGAVCPALGGALAALAACIAVSRVLAGHHYISDVLAGLAFGAGIALAGRALFPPL